VGGLFQPLGARAETTVVDIAVVFNRWAVVFNPWAVGFNRSENMG
jgi:hypothetical protein